jgi:hypothetical protein
MNYDIKREPTEAQYLLRFDDLCPTMDAARWRRFAPLLTRFRIRPILAVVPDNQDPALRLDQSGHLPDHPSNDAFWDEMRAMQTAGATIGLHGYQHLCFAEGRGLVPLHRETEFAGAPLESQRDWIRAGLEILADHRLTPQIWVAPRHGFDRQTLKVLRNEGISLISDGFARTPFRQCEVTWIPQQLWEPVEKGTGLWTICLHANTATDVSVRNLEVFLERFAAQFTSVERVLAEWPIRQRSLADRLFHTRSLIRIRLAKIRRRFRFR